jgi:hypothetical protein
MSSFNAGGAASGAASGAAAGSMIMPGIGIGTAIGAIGGGLLGAFGGGDDKMPDPVDMNQMAGRVLSTQQRYMPALYGAENLWRPQMIGMGLRGSNQVIEQGLAPIGRAAFGLGDIAQQAQNKYGRQYGSLMRELNPEFYGTLGNLSQRAQTAGMSPLQQKLIDYGQGINIGQVSPQEERLTQQASRQAYGARGMLGRSASTLDEILDTYGMRRQRETEDIQRISGIDQLRSQQEELNRAFGLNVGNLALSGRIDPSRAGGYQAAAGVSQFGNLMGLAPGAGSITPTLFNPFDPTAIGINMANRGIQMDYSTAKSGNQAGLMSGAMGLLGSMYGAKFGGK